MPPPRIPAPSWPADGCLASRPAPGGGGRRREPGRRGCAPGGGSGSPVPAEVDSAAGAGDGSGGGGGAKRGKVGRCAGMLAAVLRPARLRLECITLTLTPHPPLTSSSTCRDRTQCRRRSEPESGPTGQRPPACAPGHRPTCSDQPSSQEGGHRSAINNMRTIEDGASCPTPQLQHGWRPVHHSPLIEEAACLV